MSSKKIFSREYLVILFIFMDKFVLEKNQIITKKMPIT